MGAPTAVLTCGCEPALLASRVERRQGRRQDPSEAGLDIVKKQQQEFEPPVDQEDGLVIELDTGATVDLDGITGRILRLLTAETAPD